MSTPTPTILPIWRGSWTRTKTDCIGRKLVTVGCQPFEVPASMRADHAKLHRCTAAGALCCERTCVQVNKVKP